MKANQLTTAEEAATRCNAHGKARISSQEMQAHIESIRCNQPYFEHYLSHPEIIMGLSMGRFGRKGLLKRLEEMHGVDNQDEHHC